MPYQPPPTTKYYSDAINKQPFDVQSKVAISSLIRESIGFLTLVFLSLAEGSFFEGTLT